MKKWESANYGTYSLLSPTDSISSYVRRNFIAYRLKINSSLVIYFFNKCLKCTGYKYLNESIDQQGSIGWRNRHFPRSKSEILNFNLPRTLRIEHKVRHAPLFSLVEIFLYLMNEGKLPQPFTWVIVQVWRASGEDWHHLWKDNTRKMRRAALIWPSKHSSRIGENPFSLALTCDSWCGYSLTIPSNLLHC